MSAILSTTRPLTADSILDVAAFFSSELGRENAIVYLKKVLNTLEFLSGDSNNHHDEDHEEEDRVPEVGAKRARTGESKEPKPNNSSSSSSSAPSAAFADMPQVLPDNFFQKDALDTAPMTLVAQLHDDQKLISHIIGKGGCHITAISNATGCKVHTEKKGARPQEQFRHVFFQGTIKSIVEAFVQVSLYVKSFV
jgi:hypothetical protein